MKYVRILVLATTAAAAIAAAALIALRKGLLPGLDFGAGQYYYTDVPGWERFFSLDASSPSCPFWLAALLFFAWGWLMYRLWRRI